MRCFTFLFTLFLSSATAQVQLGTGSYNPNSPGPPLSEGPYISSTFNQKIITHDWWTSILWSKWQSPSGYSNIIHPHPFSAKCQPNGLRLAYAKGASIYNGNAGTTFNNIYNHLYQDELVVGLDGISYADTRVNNYSDWDVEALWGDNLPNKMTARMGHGFPFVYFTKEGNLPITITTSGITSISENTLYIEFNGKYYAVFAPSGSDWIDNGNKYTCNLNNKDYWSVAVLPDFSSETIALFKQHAFSFITKTSINYEWDKDSGLILTNFETEIDDKEGQNNSTLMALYRHQWLHCSSINTPLRYQSPRGTMKLLQGKSFQTAMPNIGSIPNLPHTDNYDNERLARLVKDFADRPVYNCQGINCNWGYYGNYTMGRFLVQAGQVALIADEIKDHASRDKLVSWIRSELEDYLTFSEDSRWLGYNDQWNITLLHSDNIEHCSINCLNDRNLQYGYWIRAAAIVEQFQPGWASQSNFGQMIDLMIKDVANIDRTHDMFPYMRNFDVYAGHSWALGFSDLYDGADQESSSESINFASALIYYGQMTNQDNLVKQGMWMYTTEVVATEQYWFDVDETVFPSSFQPEMVGLVRSSGAFYQLWWELRPEHVLMVNCFPWTGGSLYLGRYPKANQRIYEWISTGAGQNGIQKWEGYLWPYKALYDPDQTFNEYSHQPYVYANEIESEANNYKWIRSLQALGQIDREIYSNYESAIVFDKSGEKHYVVFNPYPKEQIVYFSDGNKFTIPADTTIILKQGDQWQITSSMKEYPSDNIHLFPSQFDNHITIISNGQSTVQLINNKGQIILTKEFQNNLDITNLSHLSPGIYTAIIQSEHHILTSKIVK